MKYTVEESLSNFTFWSGAKDRAELLTTDELDRLDDLLPEILSENPTDTEINDLFWFDFETVCELLGYRYGDDGEVHRDDDEDEEEEPQYVLCYDNNLDSIHEYDSYQTDDLDDAKEEAWRLIREDGYSSIDIYDREQESFIWSTDDEQEDDE